MHVTRPFFRGRSALARIVDNENTIANKRKEREEKENKTKVKKVYDYYKVSSNPISRNIVDTFHKTGDISLLVKMKNRTAKNIINYDDFIVALENNSEYVKYLTSYVKFAINKNIDSSLYIDIVENNAGSTLHSKMIRAYKNVYNTFLENEIKLRRDGM